MYDTFPFQRFGTYGKVEGVSETVLASDEVIGAVHPRDPSYRVIVRLGADELYRDRARNPIDQALWPFKAAIF